MAQLVGDATRAGVPLRRADAASAASSWRSGRLPLVVGVYLLVALLSLLYITQASLLAGQGYEVGSLESEREQWRLRVDQLSLQVAEARSLQTVEREAKRIGMGPPQRVIYLQAPSTPAEERSSGPSAGSAKSSAGQPSQ